MSRWRDLGDHRAWPRRDPRYSSPPSQWGSSGYAPTSPAAPMAASGAKQAIPRPAARTTPRTCRRPRGRRPAGAATAIPVTAHRLHDRVRPATRQRFRRRRRHGPAVALEVVALRGRRQKSQLLPTAPMIGFARLRADVSGDLGSILERSDSSLFDTTRLLLRQKLQSDSVRLCISQHLRSLAGACLAASAATPTVFAMRLVFTKRDQGGDAIRLFHIDVKTFNFLASMCEVATMNLVT